MTLFAVLGDYWKAGNAQAVDVSDRFSVATCDHMRINRSRRYQGEADRGSIPSKRRYCYGVRVHVVVTATGQPVAFLLLPGADKDTGAVHWYPCDLPAGARVVGDKAFPVDGSADDVARVGSAVCPLRNKNSKRPSSPWETYLRELDRKVVETTNSLVTRRFPKAIHAVIAIGFELKIVLFLLAQSIDGLVR